VCAKLLQLNQTASDFLSIQYFWLYIAVGCCRICCIWHSKAMTLLLCN